MNQQLYPLSSLPLGGRALVCSLESAGPERRRMLDLGLTTGTIVEAVQKSPAGDPVAYFFRGAVIALRREDAGKIIVQAQA